MDLVRLEVDARIAHLRLSRPEARNALSHEMCSEVVRALDSVDRADARAVVVSGEGKVFCAGADFAAVSGPDALTFLPAFVTMLDRLARHRLPTIAAIHGAALGGGLQLATACDFRVSSSEARFGIPSSRLGIVIDFDNVRRLVHLVGVANAKEILMLGRTYDAKSAHSLGLLNEVARTEGSEAAVEAAMGYARALADDLAPLAVQGVKRSIHEVTDHISRDPSDEIASLVARAYGSEDLQEGLRAMADKRRPHFHGR